MTGRGLALCGGGLWVLMMILMAVGTTSVGLFVAYAVLWLVGAAVMTWGVRREKAETFARLERERRAAE